MSIEITESAVTNAIRLREKEGEPPEAFLRLGVKGGGCSGFSYVIRWDTKDRPGDETLLEQDSLRVIVDPKSLSFLEGMTLDFSSGLNGKGFEFKNPNAKSSCGCGMSFSVS